MPKAEFKYADVVILARINKPYTYIIPDNLKGNIQIGSLVLVPIRQSQTSGIIVKLKHDKGLSQELTEISDLIEEEPVFSIEMLKFLDWTAEYYLASKGEVYKTAIPPGITQKSMDVIRLKNDSLPVIQGMEHLFAKEKDILDILNRSKEVKISFLEKKLGTENLLSSLRNLEKNGLIEHNRVLTKKSGKKIKRDFVKLCNESKNLPDGFKPGKAQIKAIDYLKEKKSQVLKSELQKAAGISYPSLNKLRENGIIDIFSKEIERTPLKYAIDAEFPDYELTDEQKQAVKLIQSNLENNKIFLIYGVTGSGKTLIYNKLIEKIIQDGGGVLFLVPEIFMSSQTIFRFKSRYQEHIATIHCQMSAGERYETWENIKRGKKRFVIGPRSSVFAPVQNLKLIIVDEEHDPSYKQTETTPFYNARDLAVVRGNITNSTVALGSATPSIESFHNAESGKYELIKIKDRADKKPLPEVQIIDMREEFKKFPKQSNIISEYLINKMWQYLIIKEQVLILQNRRGFSSFVQCRDCGYIEQCRYCSITLTFHKYERKLKCHYCGYAVSPPSKCFNCHGENIFYPGTGTQKLEEEITSKIPGYPIIRIDSDILSGKKKLWEISGDIQSGKYSVIVGTQIIAKGLDLENLNFVGVINADIGMFLPDFRASERTFQLLTQVAGRAGRRKERGEVVVQTYNPENIALQSCRKHNFELYYKETLPKREELGYPPYSRLILIRFKYSDNKICKNEAQKFANILKKSRMDAQILGPTPSVIFRVKNNFRYQILIKIRNRRSGNLKNVKSTVTKIARELKGIKSHFTIDVDPLDML